MSATSYTTDKASPFTRAVVSAMRKLYPEELADKSFDNTGLLLEAPFDPIRRQMNSVLLTIDLTKAVADEAIERKDCIVVAYHPIIFKGLKALTLRDTQQQSLLRLALEGISVYSPHTAVDAAPGGLSDWLADIVTGAFPEPAPKHGGDASAKPAPDGGEGQSASPSGLSVPARPQQPRRPGLVRDYSYSEPTYPIPSAVDRKDVQLSATQHTRTVIQPSPNPPATLADPSRAGIGRIVTFAQPQPLTTVIERIARGVGTPKGFPVAIPQRASVDSLTIRRVAVCAGSGGAVFRDLPDDVDLLFTGELSHHEALAAAERGRCVVTLFHSNTERGFLRAVMRERLAGVLKEEWGKVQAEEGRKKGEEGKDGGWHEAWEEALADEGVEVEVSKEDRDPFGVVLLEGSEQQGTRL